MTLYFLFNILLVLSFFVCFAWTITLSVVFLIVFFFAVMVLFLILGCEYVAVAYLMVYAASIGVLFVFGLIFFGGRFEQVNGVELFHGYFSGMVGVVVLVVILLWLVVSRSCEIRGLFLADAILGDKWPLVVSEDVGGDLLWLGVYLYADYFIILLFIAVLLLLVLFGVVVYRVEE